MIINSLVRLLLIFLLIFIYLIGGTLQFLGGISYYFVSVALLCILLTISAGSVKINVNKNHLNYLLFYFIFAAICVQSTLLNNTNFVKTGLYLLFFLAPFIIVHTLHSNKPNREQIKKFLLLLPIIQIGALLIQRAFGTYLIQLNNARQEIRLEDFYFGTFLLKNDHALGFTMIAILLFFSNRKKTKNLQLLLLNSLIIACVLLTNSKTSTALIVAVTLYIWFVRLRLGSKIFICISTISFCCAFILLQPEALINIVEPAIKTLEKSNSIDAYEEGIATRGQTVVKYINSELEVVGKGPYSYFNILEGSFTKAPNFSQWIWAYHDLGILGLVFSLILVLYVKRGLLKVKNFKLLTFILLFYGFFTTIVFDLTFILTYILILYLDGKSSSNTIS